MADCWLEKERKKEAEEGNGRVEGESLEKKNPLKAVLRASVFIWYGKLAPYEVRYDAFFQANVFRKTNAWSLLFIFSSIS